MQTEQLDETFKVTFWKKTLKVENGADDDVWTSVVEHTGLCDPTKALVMLHGANSPVDMHTINTEANELLQDDEYTNEQRGKLADALRDRGRRFEKFDISFRESRKYEAHTENWHRVSDHLGSKHPKYIVHITWGGFWVLAPDKRGKKFKSCTAENFNTLVDAALNAVGATAVKDQYLIGTSMGGLNEMVLLHHQVKNKLNRYTKCIIADGLLFPGDIKSNPFIELILSFDVARVASRLLAEIMLYEHEFHEVNPIGKNWKMMKDWPPTLLHSNTESLWPFSAKHMELKRIAHSLGADQIKLLRTPTTHSYFDSEAAADFLTLDEFDVKKYEMPYLHNHEQKPAGEPHTQGGEHGAAVPVPEKKEEPK